MLRHYFAALMLLGASAPVWSAGDREDYDIDKNGLIEIYDLEDLNEIRNDLTGRTLYGCSAGCPEEGCFGVELMADLDFDTNGDGVIDAGDTYWNDGKGWEPIGPSRANPFRSFLKAMVMSSATSISIDSTKVISASLVTPPMPSSVASELQAV